MPHERMRRSGVKLERLGRLEKFLMNTQLIISKKLSPTAESGLDRIGCGQLFRTRRIRVGSIVGENPLHCMEALPGMFPLGFCPVRYDERLVIIGSDKGVSR